MSLFPRKKSGSVTHRGDAMVAMSVYLNSKEEQMYQHDDRVKIMSIISKEMKSFSRSLPRTVKAHWFYVKFLQTVISFVKSNARLGTLVWRLYYRLPNVMTLTSVAAFQRYARLWFVYLQFRRSFDSPWNYFQNHRSQKKAAAIINLICSSQAVMAAVFLQKCLRHQSFSYQNLFYRKC